MAHAIIIRDQEPEPFTSRPQGEIIDPYEMNTVAVEHRGDKTIYRYAQDVSAICNQNEEDRKEGNYEDRKSEFRKVASIPMVIWNMWENSGITQDKNELRRAIERHKHEFKTTEKRLI